MDNEQLRHELAQLRAAQVEGERNQGLREEAESMWAGLGVGQWGELFPSWGGHGHGLFRPHREGQRYGSPLQQAEGKAQRAHQHARGAAEEGGPLLGGAGGEPEHGGARTKPLRSVRAERGHSQAADRDAAEPGGGGAGEGAAGLPGGAGEAGVRDEGTFWSPHPHPHHAQSTPHHAQSTPLSTAPCNILSHRVQLEEQSDQLEKLKRELEAKARELVHVQEALSRTEQVWGLPGWGHRVGSEGPLVWGAAGTSTRGHSGSGIWPLLGSQSLLPSLVGP